MAYNGFAIDKYLNAAEVTRQLDELIKKPVYSVRPDKLKMYEEEYFEKKCSKSKAMITEAKKVTSAPAPDFPKPEAALP